jgi:hypothetical protein
MPGAAHARRARLPESFLPSEIFTLGAKPVFLRDQRGEIRATPGGCFPNSCAPHAALPAQPCRALPDLGLKGWSQPPSVKGRMPCADPPKARGPQASMLATLIANLIVPCLRPESPAPSFRRHPISFPSPWADGANSLGEHPLPFACRQPNGHQLVLSLPGTTTLIIAVTPAVGNRGNCSFCRWQHPPKPGYTSPGGRSALPPVPRPSESGVKATAYRVAQFSQAGSRDSPKMQNELPAPAGDSSPENKGLEA